MRSTTSEYSAPCQRPHLSEFDPAAEPLIEDRHADNEKDPRAAGRSRHIGKIELLRWRRSVLLPKWEKEAAPMWRGVFLPTFKFFSEHTQTRTQEEI